MSTYFSIGEMSKIHNVSVQTIRYYDKIGLLKPAYINKETGYRYYSAKHFVVLGSIKQCKAMGLSLDEIKELIENYTSFDSILNIISNQKEIIDNKIKELTAIKTNITFLEDRIKSSLKEGIDEVFVKYNEERKFLKYENTKRYTDEFEVKLTRTLVDMEEKYSDTSRELAFSISYDDFKSDNKVDYNNMLLHIKEDMKFEGKNIVVIPAGEYLTLNFDDDYNDTTEYYKKMLNYINENNIDVSGDFYEIYVMTRVGADGKEKSLGQIQILIK
ncbi:MAG: MerR family transcriptional regulator [Clostridium sp.]